MTGKIPFERLNKRCTQPGCDGEILIRFTGGKHCEKKCTHCDWFYRGRYNEKDI